MPDEARLREQAREAVRTGRLPARQQDRTWGGPGARLPCAVCGEAIPQDEMEIEIEFVRDGAAPDLDKYHVHPRCLAAWELERKRVSG